MTFRVVNLRLYPGREISPTTDMMASTNEVKGVKISISFSRDKLVYLWILGRVDMGLQTLRRARGIDFSRD